MLKRMSLAVIAFALLQGHAWCADLWCAAGNVGCLIASIQIANQNGEDNTLFLDAGVFTLNSSLPPITGRLTIRGPEDQGSVIERDLTGPNFRIFQVALGGHLSLEWLAIRNGRLMFYFSDTPGGAGILNNGTLRLNRVSIYNNRNAYRAPYSSVNTAEGGGIYSNGVVTIKNSSITHNGSFGGSGGGLFALGVVHIEDSLFYMNSVAEALGGGMYLAADSVATVLRSTFSSNVGDYGGAIIGGGQSLLIESSSFHHNRSVNGKDGGAGGGISVSGVTTITSSTFSDNSRGAIRNFGDLLLTNVTVTRNLKQPASPEPIDGEGPIYSKIENNVALNNSGLGTIRMQNSILAGNLSPQGDPAVDCNSFTSLGNNIIGTLAGCMVQLRDSDHVGDPALGAFQEDIDVMGSGNYPLLPGSPATDSASAGACPAADQLGNHRIGTKCDIGAVESQDASRVRATSLRGLIRP